MASLITGAARAAHSAAASVLVVRQIGVGDEIPALNVKEDNPEKSFSTRSKRQEHHRACRSDTLTTFQHEINNSHRPVHFSSVFPARSRLLAVLRCLSISRTMTSIRRKESRTSTVVAVNDAFVTQAWREKLAPQGTGVRFIADDKGELTSSLGLIFDASGLLGSPRSKRYVIVAQDKKVQLVSVEDEPADIRVTASNVVLSQIA
ncbi:hypothetical protein J3R82DRAFT_7700 [Butyriboletus roseoflavus]|nr:hypothetical protein J3R82DRAFT_7700 [Butyriboletus roseoflavus]